MDQRGEKLVGVNDLKRKCALSFKSRVHEKRMSDRWRKYDERDNELLMCEVR